MVTIVGIYKIIQTLVEIRKYNPDFKTNNFQLKLHALALIALTLNLIPVIVICLPFGLLTSRQ